MVQVAIVYHSGYGHTAVQAHAVHRGASSVPGVTARILKVEELSANLDELEQADALIFGCPTYMGSGSAKFKEFMEASSKLWLQLKWKDKIAAGFTNSGSQSGDKLDTLLQLAVFAAQHAMVWVGLDVLPGNNSSKGSTEDLNRLGSFLGAMAQSNVDQGPDVVPPASDQRTAEALGRRVALATLRWVRGREGAPTGR
jgi:multimeric flavodoxin WrbA